MAALQLRDRVAEMKAACHVLCFYRQLSSGHV